jgi:subtilisin family serine protease
MLRLYFLLCPLLFSALFAPLPAAADKQEWIVHLRDNQGIEAIRSSSLQVLKQENQQLKIRASSWDIQYLKSVPAVEYIELNKQKHASSSFSYNDPMLLQQWGLKDIHAWPVLELYKQVRPNVLKGMTMGHEKGGQTFLYEEQPLSPGSWMVYTHQEPLSRLSVILSHVEGPWSVKIQDEHGKLIAENKSSLPIIDVLLPKKQTFHALIVYIEGAEEWKNTPSVQLYGTNAVRVAVIDSGIAPHEDFCGSVLRSLGRDYTEGFPYAEDRFGHGTFVTGVLAGCGNNQKGMTGIIGNAPIDIIPLKVLDQSGNGDDFDISQAIADAAEQEVDVINMSLAGKGETVMLRKAVMEAVNQGILIVAAAGNQQTDTSGIYPASYPGVLTVTGTTEKREPIPIANYGWEIDLSAPGANIVSTFIDNQYKTMRGTSLAVPYVSGAAALLKTEQPEMDMISLRHLLIRSAHDIGEQGEDKQTGYGLLQVEEARAMAAEKTNAIEWLTIKSGQLLAEASSQLIGFSAGLLGQQAWLFAGDNLLERWKVTDSMMTVPFPAVQGKGDVLALTTDHTGTITAVHSIHIQGEAQGTPGFYDVPPSYWAYGEIGKAAETGIINGYGDGMFRPNHSVSRRHAVMMLNRLFEWNTPRTMQETFQDVPIEMPGFLSVSSAYEQHIVKGYGNVFRPDGTLTRAQMALMLARALDPAVQADTHSFQDVPPSHHAYQEIQQLVNLGIVSKQTQFLPNAPLTRAQLSVMLMRANKHLHSLK